jgi:hypothetical protein
MRVGFKYVIFISKIFQEVSLVFDSEPETEIDENVERDQVRLIDRKSIFPTSIFLPDIFYLK